MKTERAATNAPSEPTPIRDVLGDFADALKSRRPDPVYELRRRWVEVVGPELAALAYPAVLTANAIELELRSSAATQEVHMRKGEYLAALKRDGKHIRTFRTRVAPKPMGDLFDAPHTVTTVVAAPPAVAATNTAMSQAPTNTAPMTLPSLTGESLIAAMLRLSAALERAAPRDEMPINNDRFLAERKRRDEERTRDIERSDAVLATLTDVERAELEAEILKHAPGLRRRVKTDVVSSDRLAFERQWASCRYEGSPWTWLCGRRHRRRGA